MPAYLRFENRKIVGRSKYRPSEGWIDLLAAGSGGEQGPAGPFGQPATTDMFGNPVKTDAVMKVMLPADQTGVQLLHAGQGGVNLGTAVVDTVSGGKGLRHVLTNAFAANCNVGGGEAGSDPVLVCDLVSAKIAISVISPNSPAGTGQSSPPANAVGDRRTGGR